MTHSNPQPVPLEITAKLKAELDHGATPAAMVSSMRAAGLDKIDSIKFLREHADVTLYQAKEIVDLSPAWADRRASDEAFHDMAEAALELSLKEDRTAA